MSQQINLFNPGLRPKRELLTAGMMAKAALVLMVVLGAYASQLSQQASRLKQQRDALLLQTQAEQSRLVQVAQQYPARAPSTVLRDEIGATTEKLHQREKVFEVLKSGSIGGKGGFSGLMQAFARQNVSGLWLVGFSANGAGDQMRINGRALTPDMIPAYIGKLSAEQSLRGRAFTGLQVTQPQPVPNASAQAAGQQKPVPATLPAYIEFALVAEKAAAALPEKSTNPTVTGAKS